MLALDDERWSRLTTFFGEAKDLPEVIRRWLSSLQTEEERTIYLRDLFDLFLHQNTITNAAFAVVPWLIAVCKEKRSTNAIEYLTDVACVEANRLESGVYYNREGTEEAPDWLMADYHQAITESRALADDAINMELARSESEG